MSERKRVRGEVLWGKRERETKRGKENTTLYKAMLVFEKREESD